MNRTMAGAIGLAFAATMLLPVGPAVAQELLSLGGTAFGDYYYVLSSPDDDLEDMNGFTIRRMYLTTDFDFARGFSGRARLEANQGNVSSRGMDAFVKDLYLRWRSDGGHAIRFGIIPVPHWEDAAEDVWAYRSLEATVMDLLDISSSRDMGMRIDGPVLDAGKLNYSLMVGNNNAQSPEMDRGKRVYGGLVSRPSPHLVFSVSFDYAGYTDERDRGITAHAFAGYEGIRFSAGVEPFWNRVDFVSDAEVSTSGVSLFAHASIADRWRAIGRVDLAEIAAEAADLGSTFGVLALSFEPTDQVRLMPNLWITKLGAADDAEIRARFTVEFSF